MERFGVIKNKVLAKLTENYASENKKEFKSVLNAVKSDKTFADAYLFYETVENAYFEDKETATMFLEQAESLLADKVGKIKTICESLSVMMQDVVCESNDIYDALDVLAEEKTFANIEAKVKARQTLVKHLMTPKTVVAESVSVKVDNQNLLNAVLVNNFNTKFTEQLNEEEKALFSRIVSMSQEELERDITQLKESLVSTLDAMIVESVHDTELTDKLARVVSDVKSTEHTKHNYFRLTELKNNL